MKPGVNGKILLVVDTDGRKDVERRTFSFMFEHQVEGIIYSKWVHGSITPPDELGRMPSVLVNCYDECGRFPAVVPDEVQGGATATRLLLEAGHRRIAFVNDAAPSPASVGRLAGYKAALARFDVDFDPSLVLSVTADQEGGWRAAAQVLATGATECSAITTAPRSACTTRCGNRGNACRTIFPWSVSTTRK